ncbi:probable glucosamine 6-phosphate N-acetyltransferase [Parasteatoda tepidariorum]|uniref:Glucosamine 6-phosphate N-acetyltransferase n=1 Tax=Parasteatoda tepidariorum TaxID=114398 RepID=A0A2L2YFS9_PARTP|nr:probable glucosamine 6-phosphate N-acetyltransferase [Parasteatoda tepidariorum]
MNSNNYEENCNVDDDYIYPPEILKKLDYKKNYVNFNPPISILNPGENLILRPLCLNDYNKGYLDLLAQLTRVGEVSEQTFKETFQEMKSAKNRYFITVIEDLTTNQIIGTATLFVERKFIHSAGLRGRLEDVVISNDYRGKQLGKLVVITIRLLAEHIGCYKMSLDCKDKMVKFYNQFGFICESGNSNMMTIRFKE